MIENRHFSPRGATYMGRRHLGTMNAMGDSDKPELDVEGFLAEIRKQRDEELAAHRPYPLITKDEWEARSRRAGVPFALAILSSLAVLLTVMLYLAGLTYRNLWWAIPMLLFALVGLPLGLHLVTRPVLRHYGLVCPYCASAFLPYGKRKWKRRRIDPSDEQEGARCPRCLRVIFDFDADA